MLCGAIDKLWKDATVMKGLNADEVGRSFKVTSERFIKPVWISLDASRFDQSVTIPLLQFEHTVYNSLFQSPELRRLLKWQLDNKGFARCENGSIKYVVGGSRMSGDMNTSLGNILLACLLMLAYIESVGLTVDEVALKNNGDDCVFITETENLHLFDGLPAWMRQFGMYWVVETPVYTLEEVSFCQTNPVFVNGDYRMVRDPRVVITKDTLSIKPVNNIRDWKFYRRAIGLCGMALADDVPVMGSFYQALMRDTTKADMINKKGKEREIAMETGMQFLARGMKPRGKPPCPETRSSFFRAFGISPDTQLALERQYDGIVPRWEGVKIVPKVGDLIAAL
jgi:hypothetical protein